MKKYTNPIDIVWNKWYILENYFILIQYGI